MWHAFTSFFGNILRNSNVLLFSSSLLSRSISFSKLWHIMQLCRGMDRVAIVFKKIVVYEHGIV